MTFFVFQKDQKYVTFILFSPERAFTPERSEIPDFFPPSPESFHVRKIRIHSFFFSSPERSEIHVFFLLPLQKELSCQKDQKSMTFFFFPPERAFASERSEKKAPAADQDKERKVIISAYNLCLSQRTHF